MHYSRNRCKKTGIFFLFSFLLTLSYYKNIAGFAVDEQFFRYEGGSEMLVYGGIVADQLNLDQQGFHLSQMREVQERYIANPRDNLAFTLYHHPEQAVGKEMKAYRSQFGLQGLVFSRIDRLFRALGAARVGWLKIGTAWAFSLVVLALSLLYRRIYSARFALIFFICAATSPALVMVASNLYWVPFLWFLPALLAAWLYLARRIVLRIILLAGIVVAVMVKSLCGYEYLTSITLFASAVFITAPLFRGETTCLSRRDFGWAALVFMACIVGFALALIVHAPLRGDTLTEGMLNIYQQDVRRSTYADPSIATTPEVQAALQASLPQVVRDYSLFYLERSYFILWLPAGLFAVVFFTVLFGLFLRLRLRLPGAKRDSWLLLVMFLVPVSWTLAAKSHSSVHLGVNYVVYAIGFIPSVVYICINSCRALFPLVRKTIARTFSDEG